MLLIFIYSFIHYSKFFLCILWLGLWSDCGNMIRTLQYCDSSDLYMSESNRPNVLISGQTQNTTSPPGNQNKRSLPLFTLDNFNTFCKKFSSLIYVFDSSQTLRQDVLLYIHIYFTFFVPLLWDQRVPHMVFKFCGVRSGVEGSEIPQVYTQSFVVVFFYCFGRMNRSPPLQMKRLLVQKNGIRRKTEILFPVQ